MCNFTLAFDDQTEKYLNYYYFTLEITTGSTNSYMGWIDFETAVREHWIESFDNKDSNSAKINIMGFNTKMHITPVTKNNTDWLSIKITQNLIEANSEFSVQDIVQVTNSVSEQ